MGKCPLFGVFCYSVKTMTHQANGTMTKIGNKISKSEENEEGGNEKGVISVDRSFQIMEMLVDADDGLSLADIASGLKVNKAIAAKLLATLTRLFYVLRDDATQRYFATYRISNLGLRQLQTSRIVYQCSHVLKDLAERTGELVRLAVVEGGGQKLTWVYSVSGRKRGLQIDPNYTLEISFHTHSAGKAWLSTMPFEEAFKLCQKQGLHKLTPYSRVTAPDLKEDLAQGAKQGFIVSYEENELGVGAVAAPIQIKTLTKEIECVGVVSISAPSSRMSAKDLADCGPLLRSTVAHLASFWPLEIVVRSGLGAAREPV